MKHSFRLYSGFWFTEPDSFGVRKMIPNTLAMQLPFHCGSVFGECKFDFQNHDRYKLCRKHRPIMHCKFCDMCFVFYQGDSYSAKFIYRYSDMFLKV